MFALCRRLISFFSRLSGWPEQRIFSFSVGMCTELDTQCARAIHGILYIYLTGLSNRCDCFFFLLSFFAYPVYGPIVYKKQDVFLYFLLSSPQILTGVRTWCTDIGEFSERCNSRCTTSMSYWAPKETTRGESQDAAPNSMQKELYTSSIHLSMDIFSS